MEEPCRCACRLIDCASSRHRPGRLIFYWSLCAVAVIAVGSFGLCFQPGWANGWPLGISKHAVFATFVSLVLAFILLAGGFGLLGLLGAGVQYVLQRDYSGWSFVAGAMSLWTGLVVWVCLRLYPLFRADIARDWP